MILSRHLFIVLGLLLCALAWGQEAEPQRFVADIELQTEQDLQQLLQRAEQLLLAGEAPQEGESTVTFVLHGPVLYSLVRENYADSKAVVDKAASLSALGVVEFKACRSWMGKNGVDPAQLQPFVQTVSYASEEVSRLVRERGYFYF